MVSLVAVVVGGKQVPELIEGQFLRVPQSSTDDFQFRPVGEAAEYSAGPRSVQDRSLFRRHVEATIADGKVQLAVWPPAQAVQIVTQESGIHAEPGVDDGSL